MKKTAAKRPRQRDRAGARKTKKSEGNGQAWLAEQLGISQPAISKHVSRADWPFDRHRWREEDLPAIKAHIAQRRQLNGGASAAAIAAAAGYDDEGLPRDPIAREKVLGMIVRRTGNELDNELKLGHFMKREEVERERLERVMAVREELSNIRLVALKLPIPREDLVKAEAVLEEWARSVCRRFEGNDPVVATPPEKAA